MTIDPAFNTPLDDASIAAEIDAAEAAAEAEDARYHAEMIEAWTNGRRVAQLAAESLQGFGDELVARLGNPWALMPPLPGTDTAEWHERVRPLAPVAMADVEEHLRLLVCDVYALAGTYRRAEAELAEALRQNNSDEAGGSR